MTQENLARFKALLENGSITQEEYEHITGEKRPEQPESTIVDADHQDGISNLRCMKGCCIFLMCLSALTAVLSFVFIPPKPHFGEYDIGRAFLYIFGLGFWFLRGTVLNGTAFFLAGHSLRMFRQAGSEITGYAADYRIAKKSLISAGIILAVIIIHQFFRYMYPAGS